MSDRPTKPPRLLWLALASPFWLGILLGPVPSAAERAAAHPGIPSVDAACRADADRQARSELRLNSVQWLEGTVGPSVAQSDMQAMTRLRIAGYARSANGWVRLIANCTYAKGRPAAISLDAQPAPPLDLSGIPRLPEPPQRRDVNRATGSAGSGWSEPDPAVQVTPTLKEAPLDPLTLNKRQSFLKDHLLGIKLQAPF